MHQTAVVLSIIIITKSVMFLKVVGYSRLPVASNEDGHLSLEIKKKESEVRAVQQGLVDALHKCLGSKPTLMVCIEGIKPLPDDRFVIFYHYDNHHSSLSVCSVPGVCKKVTRK